MEKDIRYNTFKKMTINDLLHPEPILHIGTQKMLRLQKCEVTLQSSFLD
jgi:hypothetical protein